MRSFQVCRCGEPMQFAETATPKPKGSEVLLKVLAAGVCHSDLHIWEGFYDLGGGKMLQLQDRGVKLPLTMGHENVGEVVAVGPTRARASRSATSGWSIPGSAAAPARCASAATSSSAWRRASSASIATAAMPRICWCRIRAIWWPIRSR